MKFGVHSILFSASFVEKDLQLLEKSKKMGFDTLEMPPFDYDNFPAKRIRSISEDLGLDINIAYGMPPEYNIISPEKDVRRQGIDFTKKLVDLSNEAGAKLFGGVIYCTWGYTTGKMKSEDEWKWGVESFREVAEHAQKSSDLLLGIEALTACGALPVGVEVGVAVGVRVGVTEGVGVAVGDGLAVGVGVGSPICT